jgi:hypothetical protein
MDPKMPENEGWSTVDIAAMLTGRDERQAAEPIYGGLAVEPSGGFHPGDGDYVLDPDYMEILGVSDPEELIRRKADISR